MSCWAGAGFLDGRFVTKIVGKTIGVNLRPKPWRNMGFTTSLDPPKSPLRRGTLSKFLFPP
jgi:hypothetical protein